MNPRNAVFVARITAELDDLDSVVNRVKLAWERALIQHEDLFLDAVALNWHGFYSGVERIFEWISKEIDQAMPSGNNWHRDLLTQMSMEIAAVRPAVLSKGTEKKLDEYRGFDMLFEMYICTISRQIA